MNTTTTKTSRKSGELVRTKRAGTQWTSADLDMVVITMDQPIGIVANALDRSVKSIYVCRNRLRIGGYDHMLEPDALEILRAHVKATALARAANKAARFEESTPKPVDKMRRDMEEMESSSALGLIGALMGALAIMALGAALYSLI